MSNEPATRSIPNTLTIAGMDPSGGAGILADVKAMSALGAYACAVVAATAFTIYRLASRIGPMMGAVAAARRNLAAPAEQPGGARLLASLGSV